MPFEILRNDIANMRVDAIVNTASFEPVIGSGTDAGIHAKAGPKLLEARRKLGRIRVGDAAVTPGFDLPASWVIHTVAPAWQDGAHGEEALLRSCYDRALSIAHRKGCGSVAFPLLAAGNLGFPKPLALQIAMQAFRDYLKKHEMQIYLVVFSKSVVQLSEQRFSGIASYIDEQYVRETLLQEYGTEDPGRNRIAARRFQVLRETQFPDAERCAMSISALEAPPAPPAQSDFFCPALPSAAPTSREDRMGAAAKKQRSARSLSKKPVRKSLQEMLEETDAGFSETLLRLIDQTGKKDSEIYNRANVSRQHFSKIRNNPDYRPTKSTALAFAIALELDLQQTRDLIGRAGYALTRSSKFDVILMYFIEQRQYDLFEINAVLFQYDQNLLGA